MPVPKQSFTAYVSDSDTNITMKHLFHNTPFNKFIVAKLIVTYRRAIALNGRLIYLEPVTLSTKYICRILDSFSLLRLVVNMIHNSPVTGRMGEY